MEETARLLVANFKGILAADESLPTIQKRFESVGIANSEENRRAYRELLFSTPGVEEYISGVILFKESLPLAPILIEKGIIPGIKVDEGKVDFPDHSGEFVTQGIGGLKERLEEYKKYGVKFTKWRAVITIGLEIPSQECIEANVIELCKFTQISQEAGLIPIVEPEVLMEGDHDLTRCEDVTRATLTTLFVHLRKYSVNLRALLLKPNMILSGKDYAGEKVSPNAIAEATVATLKRTVPQEVPGIVFLSGGQNPEEATINLNAINLKKDNSPWELSFSFGRALQEPVLKSWAGKVENVIIAQKAFLERARANWLARQGKYGNA